MKKAILLISIITLSVFTAKSQQLKTDYLKGDINVGVKKIGIIMVVNNSLEKKGAELYIPEQMAYNIEASAVYSEGDSLNIKFKTLFSEFAGKITDKGIEGIWKQGKGEYATNLEFINQEEVAYLERPQTPQPPFSYVEKEIIITNKKGGVELGGTLTIPDTINRYPLVVMATGSGAQNRDEEILGHKPFMVIADYLTRNGIAVFRYDDRGVGKSTGVVSNSTTEDFMGDVISIVKYFKNHSNVDSKKIGILGHSEGGVVAIMAAASYPKDVAFIVSLAGVAVNMKELIKKQVHDVGFASGIPLDTLQILDKMQEDLMNVIDGVKNQAELKKRITEVYDTYALKFNEEQRKLYSINSVGINNSIMQFSLPWMKYFFQLNPPAYIKKIKCPVLALNGDKDIQVNSEINLNSIRTNINNKKVKYIEIHELNGLNHLFQQADKGTLDEYFYITQTIDPQVLIIIKDFIDKI